MVDYEKLWSSERYKAKKNRTTFHCDVFLSIFNHNMNHTNAPELGIDKTITDWGCGNGNHALKFDFEGLEVTGLNDIAGNNLSEDAMEVFGDIFEANPLNKADPIPACTSYCSDVLEHVPGDFLDDSIRNMVNHTKRPGFIFFNVATVSDRWEDLELHEIIRPKEWWFSLFKELIPGMNMFSYNLTNTAYGSFWYLER